MIARVAPDPSGAWLAVVGPAGALLVAHDAARSADYADRLLAALSASDPVQPVLDVLAGSGVSVAPDFALVLTDETGAPRHAVVRGAALVQVPAETGDDGAVDELTGRGARTWMEHEMGAASAVLVAPAEATGPALPLERGAVFGARIEVGGVPVAIGSGSGSVAPGVAPVTPSGTPPAPAVAAPATAPVSVPAATPAPAATSAPGTAPETPQLAEHTMVEPEDGDLGYDRLFEATIVRPVEEAAVRPDPVDEPDEAPDAPSAPPPAGIPIASAERTVTEDAADGAADAPDAANPSDDDGDHDGQTVMSGALPGRSSRSRPTPDEIAPAAEAHRYALVMPDGRHEPLAGEIVLGRAPTARVVDGRMPRLVTIEGDPDVSRSHLRVALEGDTVVVTDLRSRNGTSVVLPGKQPQLLRADEPTPVIPGTVIDLGETRLRVERETAEPGEAA